MKKKIAALLLALCCTTAVGALAACGDDVDNPGTSIEQTEFTVSFDSNGGTAVSDQGVFGNGKIVEPGAPTKYGYKFVGWYKNDSLTEKWDFDKDVVKGEMTLYAMWEIKDATADTYFTFTAQGEGEAYTIAAKVGQILPADVILPSVHDGKPVTAIADGAFEGQEAIKSVLIPDTVKSIGARAFRNCAGLTQILGAENVEAIGGTAFGGTAYDSALSGVIYVGKTLYKYAGTVSADTTLEVKAGTVSIAASAFTEQEGLVGITLPASLKTIGNYAFGSATAGKGAGLKTIAIPDGVTTIGDNAFRNCAQLTSATLGDGVETIGVGAFRDCAKFASVNIGKKVTNIGSRAFSGTAITSLTYNASATLGEAIFENVTVAGSLTVGDDVEELPMGIISAWQGLTSVTLGAGITELPADAFKDLANLSEIVAPSVTKIGMNAFSGTAITSFTVAPEVVEISSGAFAGCPELTVVNYNAENATGFSASSKIFDECEKLERVVIGNNVEKIPNYLFAGCAVKTLVFGTNVKSIGDYAFSGASIATHENGEFVIPDSVEEIGFMSFQNSTYSKVTVGEGVKRIGQSPFEGMTSLSTVVYNAIDAVNISVSSSSSGGSVFDKQSPISSLTIGSKVKTIPALLMFGNTTVSTVTIPASVEEIKRSAFQNCTNLATVTGLATVRDMALTAFQGTPYYTENIYVGADGVLFIFNNKTLLTYKGEIPANYTLTIPEGTTTVAGGAFGNADTAVKKNNIVKIELPSSLEYIGDNAFLSCSGITNKIAFPANLKRIGDYAFSGCQKVPEFDFSACTKLEYIGDGAFQNAHYRSTDPIPMQLAFPESLEYIGDSAFQRCIVSSVDLTKCTNLTEISDRAFTMVQGDGLTSVKLPANITKLGNSVFTLSACTEFVAPGLKEVGTSGLYGLKADFDFSQIESFGDGALVGIGATELTLNAKHYGNNLFGSLTKSADGKTVTGVNGALNLRKVTLKGNITELGGSFFAGCTALEEVIIPDTVTKIGDYAFYKCAALTSVPLTNVTEIGNNAFNEAGIKSVTFSDKLALLGQYAFDSCALEGELVLGQSLTELPMGAFKNTKLTKVTVNGNVVSIGNNVFENCSLLTELILKDGVTTVGSVRSLAPTAVVSVPKSVTSITMMTVATVKFDEFFAAPADLGSSTFSASTLFLCKDKALADKFLADEGWNTKLGAALAARFITNDNYYGEGKWVINGDGVVLKYTGSKTEIVVPKEAKSLDLAVIIGKNTQKADYRAVTSFTLETGSELTTDASGAIYNKDKTVLYYYPAYKTATSYVAPDTLRTISAYAFLGNTHLTTIDLKNVETVDNYAFYCCTELASAVLSKVKTIGDYAFAGARASGANPAETSQLTSVDLEAVETIGSNAFGFNTSLHSVTIGAACTNIGTMAFGNGDTTLELTVKATTVPTAGKNFVGTKANFKGKIYVPSATVSAYQAAAIWSTYTAKIEAIPDAA